MSRRAGGNPRRCSTLFWGNKIPRSIQEVVRGDTGCISMRGDGRTGSRKTILSAFLQRPPSLIHCPPQECISARCLVAQVAFCNPQ